ncbi:hypothetical protein WH7805_11428 [Synechococcus sp. WH 7805]|nr:hypothetical protein WH7805_06466 [Synechococcus sp. WH 7805]EAR19524.1 hypothetical protein WH7805_11428 [Synechococcus sp. WH 7805]
MLAHPQNDLLHPFISTGVLITVDASFL